jgi:arylsulfatase A-like enzyme
MTTKQRLFRRWWWITVSAAAVVTCVDAVLLQRSRSIFTGGFLSTDHLSGPAEIVLFFLLSLFIDMAVAGTLAGFALYVLGRWHANHVAATVGAWLIATGPLLLGDVASYQLVRYLGAGFDLGLMFDLTGRSVSEIFAVASAHLLLPAVAVLTAVFAAVTIIWRLNRRPGERMVPLPARALLIPLAGFVVAGVTLIVAARVDETVSAGLLRKPAGIALAFVVNELTDVDRDGFGFVGGLRDPDPLNGNVFPYAREVPDDGVDQDGVAGDLARESDKYPELEPSGSPWLRRPDVVLIVLESFRADLVGATLEDQPITSVMNDLAANGLAAPRAYSHNGYTVQSRFHILAGALIGRRNTPTLIDDFKTNGYAVGYFSGQDESFGAAEYRVGFNRADVAYDARSDVLRRYSTFATPGSLAVSYAAVEEQAKAFVSARANDAVPLFMYINFEDTHFPYTHDEITTIVSDVRLARGEISPANRDALRAMYANTAANLDRAIGRVIASVRTARGRAPAVVITADHGESLFDEGFLGHGYSLNDVQTRVPFIVANLPMRVPDPVSQIDIRAALNEAMRVAPDLPGVPVLVRTSRPVFQYLGDLRRPRQIAFLEDGRRLIYDFRTARAQGHDGTSRPVSELVAPDRDAFLQLIQQWEWMNLARRGVGKRVE